MSGNHSNALIIFFFSKSSTKSYNKVKSTTKIKETLIISAPTICKLAKITRRKKNYKLNISMQISEPDGKRSWEPSAFGKHQATPLPAQPLEVSRRRLSRTSCAGRQMTPAPQQSSTWPDDKNHINDNSAIASVAHFEILFTVHLSLYSQLNNDAPDGKYVVKNKNDIFAIFVAVLGALGYMLQASNQLMIMEMRSPAPIKLTGTLPCNRTFIHFVRCDTIAF